MTQGNCHVCLVVLSLEIIKGMIALLLRQMVILLSSSIIPSVDVFEM